MNFEEDANKIVSKIIAKELGVDFDEQQYEMNKDRFNKFFDETYPKLWHEAYDLGNEAKNQGLPRHCNLPDGKFCHNGSPLTVYKEAWEQGYDGFSSWKQLNTPQVIGQARSYG